MKRFIINSLQSFASLAKVILISNYRGVLKFKTIKQKNSCIILGNGPSLLQTINESNHLFEKHDLLCVNNFVLSKEYSTVKPTFYILAAQVYFCDKNKTSEMYVEMRKKVFDSLIEFTTWDITIMVPFSAKKSNEFKHLLKSNPLIKPLYFNLTPVEGLSWFSHFLIGKKLGLPRPHNVLIPSIINMMHLGYKEIYLVGADHSWLSEISVNNENIALVNQKHFYDENESKPEKMQDYISRPRRLHEILHKFYLSFKGYWEIKNYAASKGVNIYNASAFSMIDAFERKKLS